MNVFVVFRSVFVSLFARMFFIVCACACSTNINGKIFCIHLNVNLAQELMCTTFATIHAIAILLLATLPMFVYRFMVSSLVTEAPPTHHYIFHLINDANQTQTTIHSCTISAEMLQSINQERTSKNNIQINKPTILMAIVTLLQIVFAYHNGATI